MDSAPRTADGRCQECGVSGVQHMTGCPYLREWRPLLNGEYPPPGPTRMGKPYVNEDGCRVAPIEVFALVKP